jgi:hypothetical protein
MRRQSTKPLTPNLYFECMINSRIVRDHLNIFHSNYNQIRPHFFTTRTVFSVIYCLPKILIILMISQMNN